MGKHAPTDGPAAPLKPESILNDRDALSLRPVGDNLAAWPRYAAVIRLVFLGVVAGGALFDSAGDTRNGFAFLAAYYLFGFITSIAYLIAARRNAAVPPLLTWGQVLVDLSVVAATVALTGGHTSFFTFLFVVVVLEATLLIGIADGFIYASLATAFIVMEALMNPQAIPGEPQFYLWYRLLVETMAFYLTASISGFWNLRLRRLQQFQQEVLDHLNNGFLITSAEGIVLALNKAGETILGMAPGAALRKPVQDVLRMQSNEECPVMTAIRAERDFTSYEFQAEGEDGAAKLIGLTTSRIHDARGQLTGVIASFSDLTDMDRTRRDMRRQDRLAVVGELAAGLAHEIRNPLAAIRGAVDELGKSADSPEMSAKLTSIAMRESDQLNHIVEGFLDFARNPEVSREHVPVDALVEEIAEWLRRTYADDPDLRIVIQSEKKGLSVSGDRSQLKQVLLNLARNGAEAMEGRGTLLLSVRRDERTAAITIADEGPGIDPDEVARIFEPFYTTKDTGVGMGLAVCQRIITAHDGVISVASREGGGTSMIVRLPLGAEEE